MLWTLWMMRAALAGDLVVDAAVPVELRSRGETLVNVLGPARVRLADLPPGAQSLELVRAGKTQAITVTVPDGDAGVVLTVTDKGGVVDARPAPPPPSPSLELVAPADQRFATILDGERLLAWSGSHRVVLESIPVGRHALELRSVDLLTIWARGTLELEAADRLVATLNAGRSLEVVGRSGAFRPSSGEASPAGSGD